MRLPRVRIHKTGFYKTPMASCRSGYLWIDWLGRILTVVWSDDE